MFKNVLWIAVYKWQKYEIFTSQEAKEDNHCPGSLILPGVPGIKQPSFSTIKVTGYWCEGTLLDQTVSNQLRLHSLWVLLHHILSPMKQGF